MLTLENRLVMQCFMCCVVWNVLPVLLLGVDASGAWVHGNVTDAEGLMRYGRSKQGM